MRISLSDRRDEAFVDHVRRHLGAYNLAAVGYGDERDLVLQVEDESGAKGGLIGSTRWDWLNIELLWLPEQLRGKGLGQELLAGAEREALGRGCRLALTSTFSFQAPGLYFKAGFEIIAKVDGMAGAHSKYYLKKVFIQTS